MPHTIFRWVFCFVSIIATLRADEAPKSPRATLGDDVEEPVWDKRLTVTVGPSDADIIGTNQKAIQAAVDYVARLGGGTVKILPGTYRLRNAVYLQSKVPATRQRRQHHPHQRTLRHHLIGRRQRLV
jgi:hypothetical protein